MSNRFLSFLILLWFVWAFIAFYLYFFVYYTSTLIVKSNVEDFSFTLSSLKVAQVLSFECKKTDCTYQNISPFSYTLTATKNGYDTIKKDIEVPSSGQFTINLEFNKTVTLEPVEKNQSATGTTSSWSQLTQIQKVTLIKKQKTDYFFQEILELWYFDFIDNGGQMQLNYLTTIDAVPTDLGTFDKVGKEAIKIQKVYGDSKQILLQVGSKNYIIDITTKQIFSFALTPKILYVKQGETKNEFLLVTEVGTYIYASWNSTPKYFSQFSDFVYSPDKKSFIGYVSKKDDIRVANLSLGSGQNSIVNFDRDSLDKKVLLSTDKTVVKIYEIGGKVFVETDDGKTLSLQGF